MRRAVMSVGPPGGNPTIQRTGRVGYSSADAMRGSASDTAAPAARCRNCLRGSFTGDAPRTWHPLPTNNNIEKRPECLLLAQSGHRTAEFRCPLLGVKRILVRRQGMSAFDPTFSSSACHGESTLGFK